MSTSPRLIARSLDMPNETKNDRRWLALLILCAGFLMIVLDMTIVNVALPSIKNDLGFTQASLAWVVNAYLIAYAGVLLLAGRLGDLLGRKRIFLIGLVAFTAASMLCGLSLSQPMLIAARFLQGIGGAVSSAVILGMVVTMFPEPGERARALGFGGVAVILLAAFVVRQATAHNPLLPLRLFASRNLSASNVIQAIGGVAMFGFFFMGSLDMQRVLGYGPLAIGLAFLPVSIGMGALSIGVTARLIMRFGARTVLLAGFALISIALVLAARGPVSADYLRDLFPVLALLGIGGGLAFPSLGVVAMAGTTPSDAGLASGLLNTTGQVGGALGLAALAAVSTSRTGELIAQGQSPVAALSSGYHLAWAIGAALATASVVIAATILKSETPVTRDMANEDEAEEACG